MAHGDRESNGERSRPADASSDRVARRKDRQHQHERTEHLDAEDLPKRHSVTWSGSADHVLRVVRGVRQTFENSSANDCTDRLHDHVQNRPARTCTTTRMDIHSAETFINAVSTSFPVHIYILDFLSLNALELPFYASQLFNVIGDGVTRVENNEQ